MPKLSVTVITRNESANIRAALESVAWADEIVVVDSESTDDTVAQASRFTRRVVVRPWAGYAAQKNFAASICAHDWILSLDADERVTPELAAEIRATLAADPKHGGYRIPRVARHLGRWIRTTDWYPDDQLRLYDRRAAHWTGRVRPRVGRGHRQHRTAPERAAALSLSRRRGSPRNDRSLHDPGRPRDERERAVAPACCRLAAHPPFAFLRNYLLRGGFRDGVPGFIISALNAYYVFLKFAKLWQIQHSTGAAEHSGAGFRHRAPDRLPPSTLQAPPTP